MGVAVRIVSRAVFFAFSALDSLAAAIGSVDMVRSVTG